MGRHFYIGPFKQKIRGPAYRSPGSDVYELHTIWDHTVSPSRYVQIQHLTFNIGEMSPIRLATKM